jgi:hypothetical protein
MLVSIIFQNIVDSNFVLFCSSIIPVGLSQKYTRESVEFEYRAKTVVLFTPV